MRGLSHGRGWTAVSAAVLLVLCIFINSDAWLPRGGAGEEETPGAVDLTIPGNLGPATNTVSGKVLLDPAVGENKLVNDRSLCLDGRGLIQSETSIAAAGDVIVAAFNDSRGVCDRDNHAAVGWAYSLDGGETWVDGGGLPNSRNLNNGDPWLAVSPDGSTFYLAGLWNGYQGFGFYRGTVTDKGIQWDVPTVVSFPPSSALHDKEALAVDQNTGRIYLTYTRFGPPDNGIYATHSDDGGFTWAAQVPVFVGSSQGSFPAVNDSGDLFVAYQAAGTPSTIRVSKSTDGGDSFQLAASFPFSTTGVPFMDRSSDFPQVAIDGSGGDRNGWIYVVWHAGSGGTIRPYISHSEDNGVTWSAPVPVNTDDAATYHWWPSVTVDANGTVNVVYLDRRNNPGTGLTDLYLSQSTDGGSTFTDIQVTDVTASWQGIRSDPGFTASGDYLRAVAYGTDVYAIWPDARNGDPDVYFSKISAGQIAARRNQ